LRDFIKKLYEMYRPFRWKMSVVFLFIAFSSGFGLITPYLQGRVVDGLVSRQPINHIAWLIGAALLVALLHNLFAHCRELYEIKNIDFSVRRHISHSTLRRVLGFSIGQHISENSGLKQSVINRGQHSLTTLAYQALYAVLPVMVEVCLLIGVLLYHDQIIGSVMLIGMAIYVSFVTFINSRFRADYRKLEEMHNEDSKFHGEVIRNVEVVLANAQETRAARECDENLGKVHDFASKIAIRFNRFALVRSTIIHLVRFSILLTGAILVYQGKHSVGQLVMYLAWANQVIGQATQVGSLHRQMMQLYASVKKYFDMLSIESDVKVLPNPVRPEKFQGRIEFKHVTFRYKRRDTDEKEAKESDLRPEIGPALDDVSFTIESGQTVALVGESGAGKSTIVHALLRYQDPEVGQIVVDGNDLRVLDLEKYRQSVGLVDQQVSLFDNTLRYNITYGLNGRAALVTDAELDRISEMSSIKRFFPRLEKGYDTVIGERGIKLSGGECQRVGIARALIKEPDILIFDEATSNLDSQNEALIRESIEEASKGRTTIIIAHRFSTIRNVDRVIVFDKGRVVGQGTHEELYQECESYRRLVDHQVTGRIVDVGHLTSLGSSVLTKL